MTRTTLLVSLTLAALLVAPAAVAANPHGALGQKCSKTSDCGDPLLECVTTDSKRMAGSGPAGGMCTLKCTTNDDCTPWDAGAGCFRHDDSSELFCFESCEQNNFETTQLPEDHCHGRADVACAGGEFGFSTPICWPTCTSDEQCGDQYCNKHFVGLCQDEELSGDAFAAECDHLVVPTTCGGYCAWYLNGMGQCSEPCIIGAPGACGAVEGQKAEAACLGFFNAGGQGIGDLGSCLELCSCDADCSTPGWACRTSSLAGAFGASGTCLPRDYVLESIPECVEPPEDLGACVYGEVRACKGEEDCLGTAECNADRSGYLDCVCLELPSEGEGGQGGQGEVGAAGMPPVASAGAPASSDGGEPAAAGAPTVASPHGATPESGCDCQLPGGAASGTAASWAALLLGGFLARRRRSRKLASPSKT